MNNTATQQGEQLFADEGGVIAQVREGMTVLHSTGKDIGTVERVKMGHPQAATTQGSAADGSRDWVTEALVSIFGDVDVPEPKRTQLLRFGFIRVDGPGLTDTDRFVRGDKIQQVQGDTVTLAVTKDELVVEM